MTTKALLYPDDWAEIAHKVKEANDWRCQECDRQCRRPGEAFDGHDRTLALAHISQDYEADWIQVACLCRGCHMLHDAPYGWLARLRNIRLRLRLAGQLEIFPTR